MIDSNALKRLVEAHYVTDQATSAKSTLERGIGGPSMLSFAPANMDQVAEALSSIDPNYPIELGPGVLLPKCFSQILKSWS